MAIKNHKVDTISIIDTLLVKTRGRLIKNIDAKSTGTIVIKIPFRNGGVRGLNITEELEIGLTTIEELEVETGFEV